MTNIYEFSGELEITNSNGDMTILSNAGSSANCTFYFPDLPAGSYTLGASGSSVQIGEVYVMQNGNDSTGNGSFDMPYLTVAKACSSITTSSASNRYVIIVGAGTFVETVSPQIPNYTSLVGLEGLGTASRINVTAAGNNLLFNTAQIATGNFRASIANIYLTGSTNLLIDCYSYGGTSSCVISMANVQMNGNLTFTGRPMGGPNTADFLEIFNGYSYIFGNVSITGGQILLAGLTVAGTTYITTKDTGTAATSVLVTGNINGCTLSGVTFNSGITATVTNMIEMGFCQNTTVVTASSNTTLSSDSISIPLHPSYSSIGGNLVLLSDSYPIAYSPTTPANWTSKFGSIPTTSQGALDLVATGGSQGIGNWSSTTAYIAGTDVYYNNIPYVAVTGSTGVTPSLSSSNYNGAATPSESISFPGAEMGMFYTAVNTINVVGFRYYRSFFETGTTQTINIWTATGTLLYTATITPVGTGYQTQNLITPISMPAGTSLVFSYGVVSQFSATPTTFPVTVGSLTAINAAYSTSYTFPATAYNTPTLNAFIEPLYEGSWLPLSLPPVSTPAFISKTIYAYITAAGAITYQSGGIAAAQYTATGTLTLTIQSGFFSATPIVVSNVGSSSPPANTFSIFYNYNSSTKNSLIIYVTLGNSASSADVSLHIMGPA